MEAKRTTSTVVHKTSSSLPVFVACLGQRKIAFSLSESNQSFGFCFVLTLGTGIPGILGESSQLPTKGSYSSLLPLWLANV